jgi:hypothetical protein
MKLTKDMTQTELIEQVYQLRIQNQQLMNTLDTEHKQIDDLFAVIDPIIEEIKSSNKFFKAIKIIKLAVELTIHLLTYKSKRK